LKKHHQIAVALQDGGAAIGLTLVAIMAEETFFFLIFPK